MEPDNPVNVTRRRLLQLSTIGLTTGLAGCVNSASDAIDNYYDEKYPMNRTPVPADACRYEYCPPDPPVQFHPPNATFSLYNLPVTQVYGTEPTTNRGDLGSQTHPDNTLFSIDIIDSQTAKATLKQTNVTRDIELRLYIRNANNEFESISRPLEATDTNTPETHEIEFDISSITLPRNIGSICELVGMDNEYTPPSNFEEGWTPKLLIKRHQFVGVSYKGGVNWVNADNLNHRFYTNEESYIERTYPKGVSGDTLDKYGTPAGYVETRDDANERTVFLVTRTHFNGELIGVACHIPHEPVQAYKSGNKRYKISHGFHYESYHATKISHFQDFAQTTYDAISSLGAETTHEKISVLGDIIQMIPYSIQTYDPPSKVLYETTGDCSTKSSLMATILQNDPWNIMPMYIRCTIGGTGHRTIGLDVNDIQDMPGLDNAFTLRPSEKKINQGVPDAEYVYWDMTYDSTIGQRKNSVKDPYVYHLGNFETFPETFFKSDPPDY